jgi:hypothetical protein
LSFIAHGRDALGTLRQDYRTTARVEPELATNRPPVSESGDRIADYYRGRGLAGPALQQQTSTVLGGFVKVESIAVGLRQGLRFMSLMLLVLGLTLALLLWQSARGLRAPPGAGYS